MFDAFIFDLDGTLANTEKLHYRAWREALWQNGVGDFTFEEFMAYVGTSNEKVAEDYIASHGMAKGIENLVLEKQEIYMGLVPHVELFPGVEDVLSAFHNDLTLALASSSHKKEVSAILETHGLLRYFEVIVGGDMVTMKKPDPEIYLKTSSMLGVSPGKCIAFEDSVHGVNAAKSAGMTAVAIPNEFTRDHDFGRADAVISSFYEVDNELLTNFSRRQLPD